ncbi:TPA_asm: hypothetical protein GF920_14630 [Listeria monocytogenes]|nr:hypothetical protein [Listeria monocytogenes]HAA5746307.1 hypothetical protein [Listeria monocytogenes]HAA5805823.1 hypothetical protein [Listeria monocytogenes]HAA5832751.1 hypothetical protein [Listeria monocytogenes]HAA5926466.1 hypothetical protein [Listeria monocytogenes]
MEETGPKDVSVAHIEKFVSTLVSMLSAEEFSKGVRVDSIIDMIGDIPEALSGSLDAMHLPIPVSDTTSHRYVSLRDGEVGSSTFKPELKVGASRRQNAYIVYHSDRVYDTGHYGTSRSGASARAPSVISASTVKDIIEECNSIISECEGAHTTSDEGYQCSSPDGTEDFEFVIEPEMTPLRGRNRVRTAR